MSKDEEYGVDVKSLLQRIAQELTMIRKQTTEAISYMRNAESEVPESLRRFANYMHDAHDIKYMYEDLGHQPPQHLLDELKRLDDRYRQILQTLNSDGGAIEKIRREMAGDPENKHDHTRQLEFLGRSDRR